MTRQTSSRSARHLSALAGPHRRGRGRCLLPRLRRLGRSGSTAVVALAGVLWWSATVSAQLDPLLFVKRVPPTVIIVVDTSLRMLDDGSGNIYDPFFYSTSSDSAVMGAFPNINTGTTKTYRRVYKNLQYENSMLGGRYVVDAIAAVPAVWDPSNALTANSPADLAFLDPTRYAITKAGIDAAVSENAGSSFRWGLVKLRQRSPQWRTATNCEKPVTVNDSVQSGYGDKTPCDATGLLTKKFGIYAPSVGAPNFSLETTPAGTVVVNPADNTSASVLTVVRRLSGDDLGLIPASHGDAGYEDRPLSHALEDAKAAAIAAITNDTAANRLCRNTVVVLITSGKDDGDSTYTSTHDPIGTAKTFLAVSAAGVTRRVPIHVVAVKPITTEEAQLRSIAGASGGVYTSAQSVKDVTKAINYAVQHGFARFTDFEAGNTSEFIGVSPIVGTVNLKDANSSTGAALPNTDITANPGGQALPQRSNMMVTAGFALPGFAAQLRAFRTYKPVADSSAPTGWRFDKDGTRLWPDLDGRPELAGLGRAPADPNDRNIFTYIPNGSGGGSVVSFNTSNASTLEPHLRTSGTDTAALINLVRAQPLGAIIGSTPALMDPPSLDPPPDDDYGRTDAAATFAGSHKDRRAMIFFGANDGMIHAVDARTGYEVWAFIPYNLLPKLRTLSDGQPVEQFDYFVDSSPKMAEVKLNGAWRSLLLIGEGPGGTFYQAFDVTEAGMGVDPTLDGYSAVSALLGKFDSPNESISFKWAYPNYSNFDPTYTQTFTVTDGTPGGKVKLFGDLKATASYAEKTVGFTWSDPAVGPLNSSRSTNAVIVGSGYFPAIEDLIPNRGVSAPRAGNALYLIDADIGELVGNASGGSCTTILSGSGSNKGCVNVGDAPGNGRKNTLQADPSAASDTGSYVVKKAYLGDSDGKYWRFDFDSAGTISARLMRDTTVPIYASSALLAVGSTDLYMFFATGSDLLPANSPGGSGTFTLYGLRDLGASSSLKFQQALAPVTAGSGCLATGERPSAAPSVAGDIVFYTTTTESAAAPCGNFGAKLYGLTYLGGAAYDSNANGKIDSNESPVALSTTGRATAPFIVDQHLFFATTGTDGTNLRVLGDPQDFNNGIGQVGVRILSWREVR
jgi:hypothetical protein